MLGAVLCFWRLDVGGFVAMEGMVVDGARHMLETGNWLVPHVYDELRGLAAFHFRNQRPSHTLQPTALVHEAYLRLVDQSEAKWKDRSHFLAIAATMIRRVVVDYARARGREKRGGDMQAVTLSSAGLEALGPSADVLALNQAFEKLSEADAEKARVVELRFFGGLTQREIAAVLDVSERTVERHWQFARAWLHRELTG